MRQQCDICENDKVECPACRQKSQARTDRQYDELREEGYSSLAVKYMAEEAEERFLRPYQER